MHYKIDKMIGLICLISTVSRFAIDSYLPALPAIANRLGVHPDQAELTLTSYLLGFSLSQLIYGPLSDRYGRKKIILVGLAIFLVGSLLCAAATNIQELLLARLIGGTGAGSAAVLNRAIACDCYYGTGFAKAWSYTTTTLILTMMLAPLLGGYAITYYGWQACFILATVYVSLIFILLAIFLPETLDASKKSQLTLKQLTCTYWRVLANRFFLANVLCYTLTFAGLMVYFQVSPFLFINRLGLSSITYSWLAVVIAGGYLMGGLLVNRFVETLGVANMLAIGIGLLMIAGLSLLVAHGLNHLNWLFILLPTLVYIIGARIIIPNAMANSLKQFRSKAGTAAALIGCIQMLGSTLFSLVIAFTDQNTLLPLATTFIVAGIGSLILLSPYIFPQFRWLNSNYVRKIDPHR